MSFRRLMLRSGLKSLEPDGLVLPLEVVDLCYNAGSGL